MILETASGSLHAMPRPNHCEKLTTKLARLTSDSGVYLMKDANGAVIYVGKAKSLRSRVRSYFNAGPTDRPLLRYLVARIHDFDTLVTATEKEALILENNLIKRHQPRYNVRDIHHSPNWPSNVWRSDLMLKVCTGRFAMKLNRIWSGRIHLSPASGN